jgi:hypothetical protein
MVAFIDVEKDGPSASDPAALQTIEIEEDALSDIVLALSDEPDLGGFTPGNNAPPDALPAMDGPAPTNPEVVPPDSNSADEEEPNTTQEPIDGTKEPADEATEEPAETTKTASSE